jgi:arylformamidase
MSTTFYDLTHEIVSHLPVYPGDLDPQVSVVTTLVRDGFTTSSVTIGTHAGTHIDAPIHMIKQGKRLGDYSLKRFMLPAVCIDVRQGFDADVIRAHAHAGCGVLFYTAASDYFHEVRYWHEYMTMPDDIVAILIGQGVSLVGIDAGSFDIDAQFPIHKKLLAADILLIENLTNLTSVANKAFQLIALPLKLAHDGAPARVIASEVTNNQLQ